jgi:TetR/AcrR family transcriptional regulator, cholesterol catabolism regulator
MKAQTAITHQDSRRLPLLDHAAACFRRLGYQAATVRDVAHELGMTTGAIYAHFGSKESLLVAVYTRGVEQIEEHVRAAAKAAGPRAADQLHAALTAHLEFLLSGGDYAQVVIRVMPEDAPEGSRAELVALRDRYEALFAGILRRLKLRRGIDRRMFRLLLLGALNSAQQWYSPRGAKPRQVADCLYAMVAGSLEDTR